MKFTIRWTRVVAVGLGLSLTASAVPVRATEHIIVLVSGEKAPDAGTPVNPVRPQVVRDSNQTTTSVRPADNTTATSSDVRIPTAPTTGASSATAPQAANVAQATSPATEIAKPKRQLSELDKLVDEAVAVTSRRYLTAEQHTPWQIFHGLVALRQNFVLKVNNEKTSALKWVQSGPSYQGLPLVEQTPHGGRFHPFTKPYHFEGHPNQFLAILSMAELPRTFTFRAGNGATITIDDMLKNAQADCNDYEEVTWTLWAFARYIHPNTQWTNKIGDRWSMERLVQTEVGKTVQHGACGGCHGLFALALARNAYVQSGFQLQGAYLNADMKVKRYIAETRAYQNADGSFSSNHYNGPGYAPDFNKRITASGHILEWLMIGVSNEELEQEWIKRGVTSIARDLVENRAAPAECGPLYHALHSLVLYRQRTRPELSDPTIVQSEIAAVPSNAPSPIVTNPTRPDGSAAPKGQELTLPIRVEPTKVDPSKSEPAKLNSNPEALKPATPKSTPETVTNPAKTETSTLPRPVTETSNDKPNRPVAPPMPEPMNKAVPTTPVTPTQQPVTKKVEPKSTEKNDGEFEVPLPPTDD